MLESKGEQLDPILGPGGAGDGERVAVVGARTDGILADPGDLAEKVMALDLAQRVAAAGEEAYGVAKPGARIVAAAAGEVHHPLPQAGEGDGMILLLAARQPQRGGSLRRGEPQVGSACA
jgi:hypothetical protein